MSSLQNLVNAHWQLLVTNGGPQKWLVKFHAFEVGYQIAITDTASVFLETMDTSSMSTRLKTKNKLLEAPISTVLQHLKHSVKEHHQHNFTSEVISDGILTVSLRNNFTAGVPFNWYFRCCSHNVDASSVTKQLLCNPLICSMSSLFFENNLLKEIIKKKDVEIADYRENGAQVSRPHLQTEPYKNDIFVENKKTMREYAVVISKDPLHSLGDSSINKFIAATITDRGSEEIQALLQTTGSSPSKSKSVSVSSSPSKMHANLRRKARPKHRGAYIDENCTDNQNDVDKNDQSTQFKTKTPSSEADVAVKPTQVKKRKKGLF